MPIDRPGFSHQANLGHVQNVDSGNARQGMLNTELAGRTKREREEVRFMVVVTEDVQRTGVTEEDARESVRWRQMFCCANP